MAKKKKSVSPLLASQLINFFFNPFLLLHVLVFIRLEDSTMSKVEGAMLSEGDSERIAISASAAEGDVVKYSPFSSSVDASFWTKLADLKLNTLRLNEDPIPIYGSYGPPTSEKDLQPARMRLDHTSLSFSSGSSDNNNNNNNSNRNEVIFCNGTITVLNTLEAFKRVDKSIIFNSLTTKILQTQEQDEDLSYLSSFHCICFLDLKKYTAVYWFVFPAISPTPPTRYFYASPSTSSIRPLWANNNSLPSALEGDDVTLLVSKEEFSQAVFDMRMRNTNSHSNSSNNSFRTPPYSCPPFFMVINIFRNASTSSSSTNAKVVCIPLSIKGYQSLSKEEKESCGFCFLDPSNDERHPGWPMRNLLAFVTCKLSPEILPRDKPIRIIAYRPTIMRRIYTENVISGISTPSTQDADKSLLLFIKLNSKLDYGTSKATLVGWELNARMKSGPRIVNLETILDPTLLASQSVDLNLQLMKWRLLPNLNTEMLKNDTKCLLLGAGTLGCNVARTLLGWGVRHLSIVDNGRVSHSNPVRQSLFESTDVGKWKSIAAADTLRRIFPHVSAQGYMLHIPMPGHAISKTPRDEEEAQLAVQTLEDLIRSHDVIFLLTDTRESRWLPTVLAAVHDKLLINAALGLDSWLVIRHGGGPVCNDTVASSDLGCYFCNDVVAPENSTKERTLDQQCTVTRPGLAPIASSIAVELMVALLHTKDRHRTMPGAEAHGSSNELGSVPHQIRGFLTSYTLMTPTTPRFRCCTACSIPVINQYRESGFDLVKRVGEDSTYLEQLTGLSDFKKSVDHTQLEWEDDDDDSSVI